MEGRILVPKDEGWGEGPETGLLLARDDLFVRVRNNKLLLEKTSDVVHPLGSDDGIPYAAYLELAYSYRASVELSVVHQQGILAVWQAGKVDLAARMQAVMTPIDPSGLSLTTAPLSTSVIPRVSEQEEARLTEELSMLISLARR